MPNIQRSMSTKEIIGQFGYLSITFLMSELYFNYLMVFFTAILMFSVIYDKKIIIFHCVITSVCILFHFNLVLHKCGA